MLGFDAIPTIEEDKAAWLKWKSGRIGGHGAATLCGVNQYQNLTDLYDRIVHGIVDSKSAKDEAFLSWRLGLEANIADVYAAQNSVTLTSPPSAYMEGEPRIISSIDRLIKTAGKPDRILEIKSRNDTVWRGIKLRGVDEQDVVQVQHYMMVHNLPSAVLCEANVSTGAQILLDVEADKDFQAMLFDRIKNFLADCDAGKRPPSTADVSAVRVPAVGGELVTVEQMTATQAAGFEDVVADVLAAKDIKKQATDFHDDAISTAKNWLEENGIEVAEGFGARLYFKEQAGRKTFDKKALAAAYPNIDLSDFEKRGEPFKSFRVFSRPTLGGVR